MAYLLAYWKALWFPQVKDSLFSSSLTLSAASDDPPTIRLNRGTSPPAGRKKERTLLYQVRVGLCFCCCSLGLECEFLRAAARGMGERWGDGGDSLRGGVRGRGLSPLGFGQIRCV